jgi:hypothetical protein
VASDSDELIRNEARRALDRESALPR